LGQSFDLEGLNVPAVYPPWRGPSSRPLTAPCQCTTALTEEHHGAQTRPWERQHHPADRVFRSRGLCLGGHPHHQHQRRHDGRHDRRRSTIVERLVGPDRRRARGDRQGVVPQRLAEKLN